MSHREALIVVVVFFCVVTTVIAAYRRWKYGPTPRPFVSSLTKIQERDARAQPVAMIEGRRPTVTRVGVGLLLGGLPGGLLGLAWRKKDKRKVYAP